MVAYGGESENEYCDLRETKAGANVKGSPMIFEGFRASDSCSVNIQKREFEKLYKYCFLSGITVTGAGGAKAHSCEVRELNGMWSFEGYIYNFSGSNPVARTITCNFICIGATQ